MSSNILLMSDTMIKERTAIHGNIDPQLIKPDLKVAQDMYILPIIGTALYTKLQDAVNAGSWTGLTDYKTLLDNYILDPLMYFTLAELVTTLGYQFWNKGVIRKSGENTENPSMSELVEVSNKYRDRGEWYAKRLKLYLEASIATNKFPEYTAPGNSIDTIYPAADSFTMPVYLGDDEECCNRPGIFPNKPYTG